MSALRPGHPLTSPKQMLTLVISIPSDNPQFAPSLFLMPNMESLEPCAALLSRLSSTLILATPKFYCDANMVGKAGVRFPALWPSSCFADMKSR